MTTQYFIHNGQNEQGPFSFEELKSQSLTKDTPIWHSGLESWTTVGNIDELRELLVTKATPPPFVRTTEEEPKQKKSLRVPLIIGGVVILLGTIAWLIYQNNQNSQTINDLKSEVNTGQTEASQKDSAKQNINAAITEKNMKYRNNWDTYIKVDNSEPTIDYTLGGISQFTVLVNNQTEYLLDQVDVLVEYIRKNGDIYKTETVTILNIPAKATENSTAPSSINGIKVKVSITKIISKKMHFCYPADNGNPVDPYFCK